MPETLFCSHAKDFFPENAGELRFFALQREKKRYPYINPTHTGIRYERGGGLHHWHQSKGKEKNSMTSPRPKLTQIVPLRPRFCNFLAPAKHQRLCSSFSSCSIELTEGEAPSNTQAFLCFQITQAPNMIMRRINRYFALPLSYSAKMVHFQCVLQDIEFQ